MNEVEEAVTTAMERIAMAVRLRNVAGHDWGWYSREDQRFHLQSVDAASRVGPRRVKVWLEDKGKRIFELADGRLDGRALKDLEEHVRSERESLEDSWVMFMIESGWLAVAIHGSVVTLTCYPNSHNRFTRTIDLRHEFPGAYPAWDKTPPKVSIQKDNLALAVGDAANLDDRHHIYLPKLIFAE